MHIFDTRYTKIGREASGIVIISHIHANYIRYIQNICIYMYLVWFICIWDTIHIEEWQIRWKGGEQNLYVSQIHINPLKYSISWTY